MLEPLRHAGTALYRRAVENPDELPRYNLPSWTIPLVLANLIVFIPVLIFVNYSLKAVYPVYAIIEDERPPAYEPIAIDASADQLTAKPAGTEVVSSSLRGINRMLRSQGGSFLSNFRGLGCYLAQGVFTVLLVGIFASSLGGLASMLAALLASLSLVQFSTAWVHIVISQPSDFRFYQRLPPFRLAFEATWRPVVLYWAAWQLRALLPVFLMTIMNFQIPDVTFRESPQIPDITAAWYCKLVVILIVDLLFGVFVVIPAHVILVRVQASLLPPGEDPIIPFDRSFHGQVQTALVGGRGYATMREAYSTFSKRDLRRLVILYVRIFGATIAITGVAAAIIAPQVYILASHTTRVNPNV